MKNIRVIDANMPNLSFLVREAAKRFGQKIISRFAGEVPTGNQPINSSRA